MTTMRVRYEAELRDALAQAKPGDTIELADGDYIGDFRLERSGTAEELIRVVAENRGKPVFTNALFRITGDYCVLRGMRFVNCQVTVRGNFNRVTRNLFADGQPGGNTVKLNSAVLVEGSDNRVDHNEVSNWWRRALRVVPLDPPAKPPKRNRFDHNYLHDLRRKGRSNAGEAIQVGRGANHTSIYTETLVEYNLVDNAEADGEMLSIKSSGSTVQFNTFRDSKATVQVRHGKDNKIIGNTLINMQALSIYGKDNAVSGNDLRKTPLIIRNGDISPTKFEREKKGHPAAQNTHVEGNKTDVYIGVGMRVPGGGSSRGVPATGTRLIANDGKLRFGEHKNTLQGDPDMKRVLAHRPQVPMAVFLTPDDVGLDADPDDV